MAFLLILAAPVLVAIGTYIFGKHRVTWHELLAHVAVCALVAGVSVAVVYHRNTTDVETWNGYVQGKQRNTVMCQHSYSCRCREECSGTGKSRSCRRVCDTCYEHTVDYDWDVYTTVGRVTIHRIDRQGVLPPPRWYEAQKGEPASVMYTYENFVKGAPDSLFAVKSDKLPGPRPTYPTVYDYYRLKRVVPVGVSGDWDIWEQALGILNMHLGAAKEVNILLVPTNESPSWFNTLNAHWLGGKKNDVVVVVGLDDAQSIIQWARVMAWAKHDLFKVKLRDALLGQPFTEDNVISTIGHHVEARYERKPMADFEYLKASIQPTAAQLVWAVLINLLLSCGVAVYVIKNEVTES